MLQHSKEQLPRCENSVRAERSCTALYVVLRPPRSQPKEDKVALLTSEFYRCKMTASRAETERWSALKSDRAEACLMISPLGKPSKANRQTATLRSRWLCPLLHRSFVLQPTRWTTSPRRTKEWVPQTSIVSGDHVGYEACAVNNSCSLILHA